MSHAVEVIERVLAVGVLSPDFTVVPEHGATASEIRLAEMALGRQLSPAHRSLLARWNGLDLEVLRLYGCGAVAPGIVELVGAQRDWPELSGRLEIGSDPAGFLYLEDSEGAISSFDCKGDGGGSLAMNLDDFVERVVFGRDAESFCGSDWADELRRAGLF
jgi:hypothetical protein